MASFETLLQRFLPDTATGSSDLPSGRALLRFCAKEERWDQLAAVFRAAIARADAPVRVIGVRGLSALARAGAVPEAEFVGVLLPLTKDRTPTVQASAILALAASDPLAWAPKLHVLAKTMMDSRLKETPAVAARIVEEADDAIRSSFRDSVLALARDGAPGARSFAAEVLVAMGQAGDGESLRAFRGMLDEKDPVVRNALLSVVAKLGDDEAIPTLRAALTGPPQVFKHAVALLAARGDRELITVLRKLMGNTSVTTQRKRIRIAIEALKGR